MTSEYKLGLGIVALVAVSLVIIFVSPKAMERVTQSSNTPYIEIVDPAGFINTEPFALKDLVGKKVILLDFLTYSCINCQRTFPYLNAWYEQYKDDGLEIVGIHTPEFAFEKDITNVRQAMERFGITHPIVLDNDYATWRAYGNRYWPRKYLIDISGNIVYDHIGEGAYAETEEKIRSLLEERRELLKSNNTLEQGLAASQIAATQTSARSPETYFGSLRNEFLSNGKAGVSGVQTLTLPKTPSANTLNLGGSWDITEEYAQSVADAVVLYRYFAKEVYLVAESQTPVEMEVWQDGTLINASAGTDVNAGSVQLGESRLYKIINNSEPGDHTLELRIKGAGARLYAFTFG